MYLLIQSTPFNRLSIISINVKTSEITSVISDLKKDHVNMVIWPIENIRDLRELNHEEFIDDFKGYVGQGKLRAKLFKHLYEIYEMKLLPSGLFRIQTNKGMKITSLDLINFF